MPCSRRQRTAAGAAGQRKRGSRTRPPQTRKPGAPGALSSSAVEETENIFQCFAHSTVCRNGGESENGFRTGRKLLYPCLSAVGVDEEEGNVSELEHRSGAVDGGDEEPAVGDPRERVPQADEAVEQGQQVREPIELLR